MVLNRRACALIGALLVAGCKQSLFDSGAPGRSDAAADSSDDRDAAPIDSPLVVPALCPAPCLADAASDFDGTAGGAGNRWRYLDDHRDRTWTAMTGTATKTGADPDNRITTCAANPGNAACTGLPGALLVTTAGATGNADPAIEVTLPRSQVVQISLHAFAASGAEQQIRLYRNSREDVLFTGIATAGTPLEHALQLDALAGDRFLVAVAPSASGGEVAIQLFVNALDVVFPSTCQLAITFSAASGNTVDNLCGGDFTHQLYEGDRETPPPLAAGPYPELGTAADMVSDAYYEGTTILDKSADITVQLWVKHRAFVDGYDAWLFSDMDLNTTGGLGISIADKIEPLLDISTTLTATPTSNTYLDALTPYPTDGAWHFIRVVHTRGALLVCLDGVRRTSDPLVAGFLRSSFVPYLAKNVVWTPQGAFVDGEIDDVRVLTGALPCD